MRRTLNDTYSSYQNFLIEKNVFVTNFKSDKSTE